MSHLEELITRAQAGDRAASEQLVEENAGLVWSIARRFTGRGTELEDLYQLGCLGFLKAIMGFDLSFGTQFSTYAVPKISGEIRRFLRDDGAIKVSRTLKEQGNLIRTAEANLTVRLGREPTISEISAEIGLSAEEIALAENAVAATESIQKETGEDGFKLEDVLSNTSSEDSLVEGIALKQAVFRLSERERTVIQLRYFHGLTQERVARIMAVSQVQVSRIEKKALLNLRVLLDA